MKELKKCWKKSWEMGAELATQYDNEIDAFASLPISDQAYIVADFDGCEQFFHAGFVGREPEWVEAERFGEIPESGFSMNWAEMKSEPGVSVVKIIRQDADETYADGTVYAMLGREKIRVAGWWLGLCGSDGVLIVCRFRGLRVLQLFPGGGNGRRQSREDSLRSRGGVVGRL